MPRFMMRIAIIRNRKVNDKDASAADIIYLMLCNPTAPTLGNFYIRSVGGTSWSN